MSEVPLYLGTPFELDRRFWAREGASSIFRGGTRYQAQPSLNTHRIQSICVFLILREPENLVGPTFGQENGRSIRSVSFLKIMQTQGSNPVHFLEVRFLVHEAHLYRRFFRSFRCF